jgi:hypothetical protein
MAAYEAFERVVYRELSQSAGLRSTRAVSSVG